MFTPTGCHMSHVMCHNLFLQNGGPSQLRVCYQRGLPFLVHSLYQTVIKASFSSKSSRQLHSKPYEIETWNFERRFTSPYLSFVMCHVSCVICHMSCVMCHVSCVMCPVSCVICHVSCVMCHVSCVMCHIYKYTRLVSSSSSILRVRIMRKKVLSLCTTLFYCY